MPTDLALNSDPAVSAADLISASLAEIPDDVSQATPAAAGEQGPGGPASMVPLPLMEPWATVNVEWIVPLAGKLLQLPYEQAAKVTGDDCWLVTDDQIALINPAMENAIRWVVWRLGIANTVSHPLVAFGVALGSLTAVKYGVYQFNQHQRDQGAPDARRKPPQRNQQPQRPIATPPYTNTDSSRTSGRMEESEGASYSAASPAAAKATLPQKEYVLVDE